MDQEVAVEAHQEAQELLLKEPTPGEHIVGVPDTITLDIHEHHT